MHIEKNGKRLLKVVTLSQYLYNIASLHLKVEVQWKITDFGCEKSYFRRCVWVFT